jgi:hypothetical protein
MSDERRRAPRISLDQCVEVSLGKEIFIDAAAVNISQTGMMCSSSVAVENLERIFLMINLPVGDESLKIKCEGIVMYTKQEGQTHFFGINFIDLDGETAGNLARYLEQDL